MEFKKASRDTNFDDFINGAEETANSSTTSTKNKEKSEDKQIILKLPKDLCQEIEKRITKRVKGLSLKDFTKQFLLEDNPFLTDEAMLKIYQETSFYKLNIAEYIKQKLGFIVIANKEEGEKSRLLKQKLVIYSKEEKELLKQKAEALNLPIHRYNLIKLKIGIVTTNLFNEEEMQKIIKESSKANLSPQEYISNQILK